MLLNYGIWYYIIIIGYENRILSLNDINNLKHCNKLIYLASINAKKVIMKKVVKKYIRTFIFNLKYRYHDKFTEKYEKFQRRTEAAIIIQRACHNWIFSPICKDGSIGIYPRLSMKKLSII